MRSGDITGVAGVTGVALVLHRNKEVVFKIVNLVGNWVANLIRNLEGGLSQYSNWVYCTLEAHFYNYWGLCRVMSTARGSVSLRGDYGILGQGRWEAGMRRGGSGRVRHTEFRERNQGSKLEWGIER